MASITSLGMGSGLDLDGMLTKLRSVEEQRLNGVKQQETTVNARISAYGQIKSALEAVQAAAITLADAKTVGATKGSATGSNVSVTANAGALAGRYAVVVSQLANAQSLRTESVADRNAAIGVGGTIKVTMVDGTFVEVNVGTDTSLNGIMKAINATDNVGVRASIINNGSGGNYLVFTAKNTGMQAAVKMVGVNGNADLNNILAFYDDDAPLSEMVQATAAANALFTINGIPIASGSNTVTAIDNVVLTLTEVGTSTVDIKSDSSPVSDAVAAFVTTYNALQTAITTLTAYDAKTKTAGIMIGDSAVRSVQTSLASALRVGLNSGSVRSLDQLGISTDPNTGKLNFDKTKLDKSVANDPKGVNTLLANLSSAVVASSKLLLADNGSIATRTQGLSRTVTSLKKDYASMTSRIDAVMNNYRRQFIEMDKYVAKMNGLSNSLKQQFDRLSGTKS